MIYEGVLQKGTEGAAGYDLQAVLDKVVRFGPGQSAVIPTGVKLALPDNYYGMVCSRSGLAAKKQIAVLNAPGIIDSDYRGEIKVILYNHSHRMFKVQSGDRIAQLLINTTTPLSLVSGTVSAQDTDRGASGFGSTGEGRLEITTLADHAKGQRVFLQRGEQIVEK